MAVDRRKVAPLETVESVLDSASTASGPASALGYLLEIHIKSLKRTQGAVASQVSDEPSCKTISGCDPKRRRGRCRNLREITSNPFLRPSQHVHHAKPFFF